MAYAIKFEIRDPRARTFVFAAQKTMYGGKKIAVGDTVLFASENEGGRLSDCGERPASPICGG